MTELFAPLLSGIGLFFCGVQFIAANLAPLAGPSARRLLRAAVADNWRAAAAGILAGLISQSTNAVSLIVVSFVRAGLVTGRRAMLLPAWAHVGAAGLVIVVSFQTSAAVAYVLALAGVALYFDFDLSTRARHAWLALLGSGMLLLGIENLKLASGPLRASLVETGLVDLAVANPAIPLGLGVVMAVLTQSSTVAGAVAVTFARVGVFDVATALFLLAGANGGSAINYAILARKGEAVSRRILLFQTAQKLFGTAVLVVVLLLPPVVLAEGAASLSPSVATQLALVFLTVQAAGSLVCTLGLQPISAFLERLIPSSSADTLEGPAYLVNEAVSDPALALILAGREQRHLFARLPLMLERLRHEGDQAAPSAQTFAAANRTVTEALERYLGAVLEGEPDEAAVGRAMRLQHAAANTLAASDAAAEFVRAAEDAGPGEQGALRAAPLVEALHLLLGLAVDALNAEDPEERAFSLAFLVQRGQAIDEVRHRLMAASEGAPARAQEALFRATVLFERVVWLARETVQIAARDAKAGGLDDMSAA